MTAMLHEALECARRFVQEEHPQAGAAALAGSVAAGHGTRTSDLDIVIYYDIRQANYAETLRYEGWLVETFVYGAEALEEWFDREVSQRRPVALDMWAHGVSLLDTDMAEEVRLRATKVLADGPHAPDADELSNLRYGLTAALDDHDGVVERAEEFAITTDVFKRAGELLLLSDGRWLGTGKWLVRRLAQFGDHRAQRLVAWAGTDQRSPNELYKIAQTVLDSVGGHLQEGHIRGTKD